MIIRLANKHIIALDKMIDQTTALGGIPSQIELDIQEFSSLLYEINALSIDKLTIKDFNFKPDEIKFSIMRQNECFTPTAHQKVIDGLVEKSVKITYKGVPLILNTALINE